MEPTVYSWCVHNVENAGRKIVSRLQDGEGSWCAITAGGLETPRIEEKRLAMAVAGRSVGMAVNQTVRLGKEVPEGGLDILPQPRAMGEADGEVAEGKYKQFRILRPHHAITHVPANCINGFIAKDLEDRRCGEVAGMDDNVAMVKTILDLLAEYFVRPI